VSGIGWPRVALLRAAVADRAWWRAAVLAALAAIGLGALVTAAQAQCNPCNVTVATDPGTSSNGTTGGVGTLSWAIATLNASSATGQVINIETNVTLGGPLSPIFNSVTINGYNNTISGGGTQRIFMIGVDSATQNSAAVAGSIIAQQTNVAINQVTLANGLAQGGTGSGGGLGAGGALFVNQSGNVTLTNVSFSNNTAHGGDSDIDHAGGGGLGGSGSNVSLGAGGGGGGGIFGAGNGGGGGVFGNGGGATMNTQSTDPTQIGGGGGYSGTGGNGQTAGTPGSGGVGVNGLLSIAGLSGGGGAGSTYPSQPGGSTSPGGPGGSNGGGGGGSGTFTDAMGTQITTSGGGGFGGGSPNCNVDCITVGGNGGFGGGGGTGGGGFFGVNTGGKGGFGGGGGASGGNGGFGGGGGGGDYGTNGGNGGYGGGGGAGGFSAQNIGGNGGFGAGGGGGITFSSNNLPNSGAGAPGFGGGPDVVVDSEPDGGDNILTTSGGGGAGMGGAVFVVKGGSLTINGTGTTSGGTVAGGFGANFTTGSAFGSGFFVQGSGVTFGSGNYTMSDVIADQNGSGGSTASDGLGGTGGSSSITKNGTGALTLSAANTYSGGTTLTSGTIIVGTSSTGSPGAVTSGALGTGTLAMAAGTTLAFNSAGLTVANNITISGDPTYTTTAPNTNPDMVSGAISDATGGAPVGAVEVNGGGSIVLSGANTYSGGTTICLATCSTSGTPNTPASGAASTLIVTNSSPGTSSSIGIGTLTFDGGTLQVQNTNNGLTSAGNLTFNNNVVLNSTGGTFDTNGTTLTWTGVIADAQPEFPGSTPGTLTVMSSTAGGVLVLSGANTYGGGTVLTSGTLQVDAATIGSPGSITSSALGTGTLTLNGGTLQAGGNFTTANAAALNTAGGTIDANGHTFTYSGVIANGNGTTGALTIADSANNGGVVVLSGANTYGGGTILTSGTLQVDVATVGSPGAITSSAIGTGTLTFNGGTLQAGGNFTTANAAALNTAGGTIDANGHTFTYSGVIANGNGTTGALTITDSTNNGGIVVLTGANTYGGGTTISADSTLSINSNGAIGSGALSMDAGSTLIFTSSMTFTHQITITGDPTFSPGSGITVNDTSQITGSGDVVMNGAGTYQLANSNNNYTGTTTVTQGTLEVGTTSTTGAAITQSASLTNNATFQIDAGNSAAFTGNSINNATLTDNGTLSVTGTLTNSSTGTLSSTNSLSVTTLTNSGIANVKGTLNATTINNSNTFNLTGALTGTIGTFNQTGGTLDLGGNTLTLNTLALSGGSVQHGAVDGAITSTGGTVNGIGGTANLTVSSGTTTLEGANTYNGATVINGGALTGNANNVFSAASALSINTGGTVGLGGFSDTISSISLAGGTLENGMLAGAITSTGGIINGIGGTASLTVSSGTTTLEGSNTYSGTTVVNGGILTGNANNVFSASSVVTINGGGTVDLGGFSNTIGTVSLAGGTLKNGLLAGAITSTGGTVNGIGGTASLTAFGGTTTLQGTNGYSGATTIASGATLALTGTASIAQSSFVLLATGATFDISGLTNGGTSIVTLGNTAASGQTGAVVLGGNTLTLSDPSTAFAGVISGNGALAQSAGVVELTGANLYSGGTLLNGGTLIVGNNGALGTGTLSMAAGTTLAFLNTGNFNIANKITITGDPIFAPQAGTTQTLSGVIADGAIPGTLEMDGFGVLVLAGANTYTGATNINAGVLDVTGSIASSNLTTVASGAVVTGTGAVGNLLIKSGGTFVPGNGTPGTALTINGNLAFQSGALYVIYLNPATSSFATVTGTASLAGTVQANFASGGYVTRSYDIVHAAGLNGTFSGLTATGAAGLFKLDYTATDVFLDFTPSIGTGTPLYQNEQSVTNAINGFLDGGGALPTKFLPLFSLGGADLQNALSQLDGEDSTGAEHGAFELMNEFMGLMLDPFVYGRGGPASGGGSLGFAPDQQTSFPPDVALAYAGVLKAPPKQSLDQRWTVWGSGFGGSGTANGNSAIGSNNVTTGTYGFAAGADYHASPDTVLGFALAGAGTNWNLAQSLGTGRSDAFQAGVYGTRYVGPAYLGAAFAFTNNWFTTNRTAFAGDQLTARLNGQSYGARLEGGYRYAVTPAAGVTPYGAIQAQNFHTPSYTETDLTGGGFGLTYNAMSATDTRSELGGRFDALTAWGAMPLQLRARVAWAHDWVSNPALNASFETLPGSSFTVDGAPIPHDSALTSAGAQLFLTPNWSFLAKFDGEFASGSVLYAGSGTLSHTW
jgi:autotransporter-associated beta strand protein